LVTALPVGVAVLLELELDAQAAGGIATGALIGGFVAFDAPARTRLVWQLAATPLIAACAAIGVLSSGSAILAVAVMALVAALGGFCVAISPRVAVVATLAVLALLIAQGLRLSADDATRVVVFGGAGAALQACVSLAASAFDRTRESLRVGAGLRAARDACARNLTIESHAFRHALRWGAALGAAVAVYRFADLQGHGYWVPLTVLFVLRPEGGDTRERLPMRAAGTVAGLAVATALGELLGHHPVPIAIVLTIAAALSYALVATAYAQFTCAITVFVVLLSDALGEHAVRAAGQRALATAIGLALAGLAFIALPNRPVGERSVAAPAHP
jgi:hypothetical protein